MVRAVAQVRHAVASGSWIERSGPGNGRYETGHCQQHQA
jgi:hypothetical protein